MKQRTDRLGAEIQAALAEIIARGEVSDPRVRNAGLLTITRVRVTGDLREARVGFTAHGADEIRLSQAREGLKSARSYLQQSLARRLRARKTPLLSFEIDHGLDHAFHVDSLLREAAASEKRAAASGAVSESDAGDEAMTADAPDDDEAPRDDAQAPRDDAQAPGDDEARDNDAPDAEAPGGGRADPRPK